MRPALKTQVRAIEKTAEEFRELEWDTNYTCSKCNGRWRLFIDWLNHKCNVPPAK